MNDFYPQRIVCLTEETTEILYLLGEQDRIVGISGYTVRPPQARKEKPKVAAFSTAKIDKILALEPDLVVGFSDLQADIAADLIRAGVDVRIFNQRSVTEILNIIVQLGAMVGAHARATALAGELQAEINRLRALSDAETRHPFVYFEEWDEPIITGIRWVSELIEIAGGRDCFAELAHEPLATNRIVHDPSEVVRRAPDIIIGSWCGKRFSPQKVCARPGWDTIPAVRNGHLYEIKSANILQPGPAALGDGLRALRECVEGWLQEQPQ